MQDRSLNPYRQLGKRINAYRERLSMSRTALGRESGLDRFVITRIEQGDRKVDWIEMQAIARALGRDYKDFEV